MKSRSELSRQSAGSQDIAKGMTRRQLLLAGGLFLAGGASVMSDAVAVARPDDGPYRLLHVDSSGTRHLAHTHHMVGLPDEADGLVIIHVTDVHGDHEGVTRIGPRQMKRLAGSINNVVDAHFGVDDDHRVLALTGDYVNHVKDGRMGTYPETAQKDFEDILFQIDTIRANHRLAVRGNHDYNVTWGSEMPSMLVDHGYRMNGPHGDGVRIRGVECMGFPDFVTDALYQSGRVYSARRTIDDLSDRLATPEPKVVLTHSACLLDPQVTGVRFDNMIALTGHVHGCQFPNKGIHMRGLRLAAQIRMHGLGYRGDMWESRLDLEPTVKDGAPSSIHVGHGVGDHPQHQHTRMSTRTVVYIELRKA